MSGGRDRRPTTEPADEIYELDLEGENAEDVLRDAVAATEASEGSGAPSPGGVGEPDDMRERYLRALADFDNYRKRVERERAETARFALAEPLRGFLGVVDNLDRALRAGGSFEDLKAGVGMILRQTGDLLRRFGVEEIEALGQPFDPAIHEAVIRSEDPEVDHQTVSEEFQKGYLYRGRLLRPAMVRVAVPEEASEPASGESDDAAD